MVLYHLFFCLPMVPSNLRVVLLTLFNTDSNRGTFYPNIISVHWCALNQKCSAHEWPWFEEPNFFSHKCPNQRGKHIMSGGMFQWWFNDEIVEHHEAVCIGSRHVNGGYSLGITWWRVGIKFMHFPSWIDSLSAMNIWCHYIKLVSVSIRLWLSLLHTCKGG